MPTPGGGNRSLAGLRFSRATSVPRRSPPSAGPRRPGDDCPRPPWAPAYRERLARRDPDKLGLFAGFALAIPIALAMSGGHVAAAVALPVGLTTLLAYQRRMEHATDARALTLGIRAESLISGLRRLHDISQAPVRWSRLHAIFLTHPSLEQRAQRIGQAANLDAKAIASILEAPAPPGPRHAIPSSLDAGRVFGSEARRRMIARLSWTSLAATALVPACVIAALGPAGSVPRLAGTPTGLGGRSKVVTTPPRTSPRAVPEDRARKPEIRDVSGPHLVTLYG